MILHTERLIFRPWTEDDAESIYEYAKDPEVGPIGAIALKLNGHTDMTERDDECELGYWIGKPYWCRGYMPEAAKELLRHGFEDLGMTTMWCGYYDGNSKSKRVQEKVGFEYHHTCNDVPVTLLNEIRVDHTNVMTKAHWEEITKIYYIHRGTSPLVKKSSTYISAWRLSYR